MDQALATLTTFLCGGIGLGVGVLLFIAVARQFLIIGRPNEILIFSGRQRALTDGSSVGYRELVGGGRSWRIPLLEKVDWMHLNTIPIDIKVSQAYSKGGIPLNVHAVANVKVSSDPNVMKNAVERFMGRDPVEIQRVAKETLEGHLRGVLASLTPEEVNEDRLKFATALVDEAEDDFAKLGLALDVLKIQNVSDDTHYLDSIGRKRISEVIRDAEVAESTAMALANRAESLSRQQADVAVQSAETAVVEVTNALRQLKAELEATAQSEEEKALAGAMQARAEAEADLQEIRQELEKLRLEADVILPAQSGRAAEGLRAAGAAADIEANGKALALVLDMMTKTWLSAGSDAKDIFLIQQIEAVLQTVVSRVNQIEVDEVTLLDGGDGQALPRYVASYPATVRRVLDELRASTGLDVTGILSGSARLEMPSSPKET
jgi:flotillin